MKWIDKFIKKYKFIKKILKNNKSYLEASLFKAAITSSFFPKFSPDIILAFFASLASNTPTFFDPK